jgi:putative transposase
LMPLLLRDRPPQGSHDTRPRTRGLTKRKTSKETLLV